MANPGDVALDLEIREARPEDAAALAELLNVIIARGGTTAHEIPFTPESFSETYITGSDLICCFVAIDRTSGCYEGFQSLGRDPNLPVDCGDIGTFARIDGTKRGIGRSLFTATRQEAERRGLGWINATIRADNTGGLTYYSRMGFEDHSVYVAAPLLDGTLVERISKRFGLSGSLLRQTKAECWD